MSKIYILRPLENINPDPWEPWYDKAFGFVVEANSPTEARKLASEEGGDENRNSKPWLDPSQSTCKELKPSGKSEVIIVDFASA